MDAAEDLFARQRYEGTTLRQIAAAAGLKEPGIYNHFSGKQALYEAVLHRALNPLAEAMSIRLSEAGDLRDFTELPAVMTDLLLQHPQMAALFQQALQGDSDETGTRLVQGWLEKLFSQGLESIGYLGAVKEQDAATLAINVIAMFNLTTGYFLAQRAFDTMADGDLHSPDNIARQKVLLHKVIRAMLIN
jgi:AcrR family transcriptional regulator